VKKVFVMSLLLVCACSVGEATVPFAETHTHDEPNLTPVNSEQMGVIGLMETDETIRTNCNFWRDGSDTSSARKDKAIFVLITPYDQFGASAEMKIEGEQKTLNVQSTETGQGQYLWDMSASGIRIQAMVNQISEMAEGDGFRGEIEIVEPKSGGFVRFGGWCDNG